MARQWPAGGLVMAEFLLELRTEDLPARMQRGAAAKLRDLLADRFEQHRLGFDLREPRPNRLRQPDLQRNRGKRSELGVLHAHVVHGRRSAERGLRRSAARPELHRRDLFDRSDLLQ